MVLQTTGYGRGLSALLGGLLLTTACLPSMAQPLPPERQQSTAQQQLAEGIQLGRQGTAQSLQQALAKLTEAIRLSKATDDKLTLALALLSSGRLYDILNQRQNALNAYSQALPLWQDLGDRSGEARTLNNIGAVYSAQGEFTKALDYFNRVLPITRDLSDPIGEARTLNNIAWVYREDKRLTEAMSHINSAITLIENLRNATKNERLRGKYSAILQDYNEFKADLQERLKKPPSQ